MSKSLQFVRTVAFRTKFKVNCHIILLLQYNNIHFESRSRSSLCYFSANSSVSAYSNSKSCREDYNSKRLQQCFTLGGHQNQRLFWTGGSQNMALSDEDAKKACVAAGPETEGFFFQQTMLRIKDPTRSLDFYTRVMGMTLLLKLDFPEMEFSLYFLGYEKAEDVPTDPKERAKFCFSRKACLELTHNHGTEKKEDQVYHNGNSDPRGFGHIGIVVPDVYKACERFEQLGVNFIKKPDGGKMKGLAFVKDPDDYWIEILNPTNMAN